MRFPRSPLLCGLFLIVAGASAPVDAASPEPIALVLDVTDWADETTTYDASSGVPVPAMSTGIGPGSKLLIDRGSSTFACTANFVWRDQGGSLYLGAAGHCFLPAAATASHGPGADYDPRPTNTVRVCVSGCAYGGQVGFVLRGQLAVLGDVVYARQADASGNAIGNDFGLVKIPTQLHGLVRSEMPVWGGYAGTTAARVGLPLCHYGNGVVVGEAFPTMARAGVAVGGYATGSWRAALAAANGDSGSAVISCAPGTDGIQGGAAVGILTHLVAGFTDGTTVDKAVTLAGEAGLSITIVE